jgi:ketosteroid isomerase-like protein
VAEEAQRIVTESVDAWNSGDLNAVLRYLDPDVELIPLRSLLEGGAYHGHDGMRRYAADIGEEWERMHLVIDEMRDVDDDVLVLGRFQAKGKASGMEIDAPAAWLTTVRDGRVTRMQAFSTRDDALRATGLEV